MRFARKQGVIKGGLWHQGESDTVTQVLVDGYEAKLTWVIADVRAAAEDPLPPFAIGNLPSFMARARIINPVSR